ncbi:MAG TPA: hypothetical protein VH596_00565 [Terriglobales bacterium]
MREKLAALSFSEKIRILEKLRDRSKAIAAAGLRKEPSAPQPKSEPVPAKSKSNSSPKGKT